MTCKRKVKVFGQMVKTVMSQMMILLYQPMKWKENQMKEKAFHLVVRAEMRQMNMLTWKLKVAMFIPSEMYKKWTKSNLEPIT